MNNPKKDAVLLILQQNDKILFVKRAAHQSAGGYWCPVSGRVEQGETQAETVVREAKEEVGLVVRAIKKVGEIQNSTGEYLMHWWLTEVLSGQAYIAAPDEIEDLRWATIDELKDLQPHFSEDIDFIRMTLRR